MKDRRLQLVQAVEGLRDPTRRGILLRLYDEGGARSVDDVAATAGVHRSVARVHLEHLVALGLLEAEPRRGARGKPAKLYRRRAGASLGITLPTRRFEELATLLAGALGAMGAGGAAAAREAGRRLGRMLQPAPAPTVAAVLEQLRPLGAAYAVLDGDVVVARNCVFSEACAEARPVVCSVQAGLLEGAFAAAGTARDVETLGPRPDGGCAYWLIEPGRGRV